MDAVRRDDPVRPSGVHDPRHVHRDRAARARRRCPDLRCERRSGHIRVEAGQRLACNDGDAAAVRPRARRHEGHPAPEDAPGGGLHRALARHGIGTLAPGRRHASSLPGRTHSAARSGAERLRPAHPEGSEPVPVGQRRRPIGAHGGPELCPGEPRPCGRRPGGDRGFAGRPADRPGPTAAGERHRAEHPGSSLERPSDGDPGGQPRHVGHRGPQRRPQRHDRRTAAVPDAAAGHAGLGRTHPRAGQSHRHQRSREWLLCSVPP